MIYVKRSKQKIELSESQEVLTSLEQDFGKKCAFCEQSLDMEHIQVCHFKPVSLEQEKGHTWSNLFPSCPDCKDAKGEQFPRLSSMECLYKPDRDDPEPALIYSGLGFILPLKGDLKASVTIEAFCLNRPDLVAQRRIIFEWTIQGFRECLDEYRDWGGLKSKNERNEEAYAKWQEKTETFFNTIKKQSLPTKPFAGVYRFLLKHFTTFYRPALKEAWQLELLEETGQFIPDQAPAVTYSTLPRLRLQRLRIKGIRCFEDVVLNFNGESSLILGTNGRGKTTLFQLPALLVRGMKCPPTAYNWKRLIKAGEARVESQCEVTLQYNEHEIELLARMDSQNNLVFNGYEFLTSLLGSKLLLLAYGAGRNVARGDVKDDARFDSIATLFGENGYLKNIKDSPVNELVKNNNEWILEMLNKVISLGDEVGKVSIEKFDTHSAYFKTPTDPEGNTPLEAMSDGFRATYAWLFDFLVRVAESGDKTQDISGIVMVDEIDLHLHPIWQRAMIPTLREAFPNVQFIFTSHSPFTVQAMDTEQVFLLRNEGQQVKVLPLRLEGTPDGHEIESIIEKTIALETDIPSVSLRLFEKIDAFRQAVQAMDYEKLERLFTELQAMLPSDSGYRDFVALLHDSLLESRE